ncbi:VOC family protein [Angustibacter aerolatus]
MPTFAGVNHFSLSVTDLDASERFYTEVLGFLAVLDSGPARVLMHNPSGFTISIVRHPEGTGRPFSETNTGMDHIGLTADSRDALVAWQERLKAAGVTFTPVQDTPLGHHLNFRDPDGIPLELQAPSQVYAAALAQLREREVPDAEILAIAEQLLGPELVARR